MNRSGCQRGRAAPVLLAIVLALLAVLGYLWLYEPEALPVSLRPERARIDPAAHPGAKEYAPPVYRWRDDAGVLHITDAPPQGRPYETVRIDPDTNVVPSTLPPGQEHHGQPPADEND